MTTPGLSELIAAWRACSGTDCHYARVSSEALRTLERPSDSWTDQDLLDIAGRALMPAHDCPVPLDTEEGLADLKRRIEAAGL